MPLRPSPPGLDYLPNSTLTPGVVDPTKTVDVLCAVGYSTKAVRPPVSYTDNLKVQQMQAYHRSGTTRDYEEDHLVPLEMGGAPMDPHNLWPEPWNGVYGAHIKDSVENASKKYVCQGDRLTASQRLLEVQRGFETNWIDLGRKLGAIQ